MIAPGYKIYIFYMKLAFLSVFIFAPWTATCWDFRAVDLPDDVFIPRFSIWRNRAFLAIPRWQRNGSSEDTGTLFEAVWPESSFPAVKPRKVVSSVLHNKPVNDDCLRSVVDVDVDGRGRLWALEVPDNNDCTARIVLYNLKRNNLLVSSTDLTNVPTTNLRALAVDQSGSRAYIGDSGDQSIIAFMPEKEKWWTIKMVHGPEVPRVFSTDLAISKKNSMLYVTGSATLDLFSVNLEELWNQDANLLSNSKSRNVSVIWHGTKMAASAGLFCDVKDGLHYFMSSERASVRWDTRLPLRAESHSVLVQNEDCPCITDYAMDSQKNLWGLINSECPPRRNGSPISSLKFRTIKIGKYPTS
ncbi:PREDICTED: uncharacterized protein LOC107186450 [Dufourea novaeangliae]|uniref:uncharacterized protein LOC107186450 n=1 Tax=Dufourea novaeangliae TaxID=178035 RepID=UPI0007678504|nr:PREDICTED: uncharacterized protein LOC107186450 [Dufourea novaeangliae]